MPALPQAGRERDNRPLDFHAGYSVGHGEDDGSEYNHGAQEGPEQRKLARHGRAPENVYSWNAAVTPSASRVAGKNVARELFPRPAIPE